MTDILDSYKKAQQVAGEMKAWRMRGAGLENFGISGKTEKLPLPVFGPDEILARTDAVGICFSDVKLITQGSQHKRILGRDLEANPATPGHETSLTVVGVGENVKEKFKIGDRFIPQPDIYYKGVNVAYGYALAGGFSQYVVMGKEILEGDEGCYLIPVQPGTGYVEAALVEPWTCVVASYRIRHRRSIKAGGHCLILAPPGANLEKATISRGIGPESHPNKLILAGDLGQLGADLTKRMQAEGAEVTTVGEVAVGSMAALSQSHTSGKGFDDIVSFGRPPAELAEELSKYLARGGVLNMICSKTEPMTVSVDVGRIHYADTYYVGCSGPDAALSYMLSRDSELLPEGCAWFIGAAGPMGQMHVQLAIRNRRGPKAILCTDVDDKRLAALRDNVLGVAESHKVQVEFINPTEVGNDGLKKAINDLTGGRGFDDIVLLAPVAALVTQASDYLADGGAFNIFAGVPEGTVAEIDMSTICQRQHRIMGRSGSLPSDMVDTLGMTERGEISTSDSCAAIGGIHAVHDGVEAVKAGTFPGKTVIFPHIEDLPLTALPDLHKILPNVAEKLQDGRFWTKEAEEELLREKLR